MEIKVRLVCGKFIEVTASIGDDVVQTSLLNAKEATEVRDILRVGCEDITYYLQKLGYETKPEEV